MNKLLHQLSPELLERNKGALVPSIFTSKQLGLIHKKLRAQKLNPTERSYFSRTISKKLEAIDILAGTSDRYFISGERFMLPERKKLAWGILRRFEKNHKNGKIIIAGSFLYSKKYRDLDIFIISKYDKDDFKKGKLHINYLSEDNLDTVFLSSLTGICLANFNLSQIRIKETITVEQIISKYQEIMQDIDGDNKSWLKRDLRDFMVNCYYARQGIILNSLQLRKVLQNILPKNNKNKIIQKMFVNTLLMGFSNKEIRAISLNMIRSYRELIKEYKHKQYYQQLIDSFEEVLNCAS